MQIQSLLCDQLAHIDADVMLTVSDYNVSGLELINIEDGWEAGVHSIEAMGLDGLRTICERELVQIDESAEPEPEPEPEIEMEMEIETEMEMKSETVNSQFDMMYYVSIDENSNETAS